MPLNEYREMLAETFHLAAERSGFGEYEMLTEEDKHLELEREYNLIKDRLNG